MSKEAMNLLTMTDEDLVKHASKQVQALRMALDMIECEKHDRRHVRWAIIDALKEEAEQPSQHQEPVGTVQCINGVTIGYLDVMQPVGTKLYTAPQPAQPSKPLTKDQIAKFYGGDSPIVFQIIRDTEAAHGIKENT